ncbi:hypothetical protein KR038_003458, partial [Drosophila bunnanda]
IKMNRKHLLLILIWHVSYSWQILYQFTLEDENIYSDCINAPPGSRNISGLFDLSRMTFTMDENGVYIEGNLTIVWNVQPTDNVMAEISISYFDRGSWMPTLLNLAHKNLCEVLYDEKQFMYIFWFQHVTNIKDVKDKCINNPGTILIFEPFYSNAVVNLGMSLRSGRYLITIMITAQDQNGVKRENSICFGIRGEFNKIQ